MSIAQAQLTYLEELADFLASGPSPDQIIAYHASAEVHEMGQQLLAKLRNHELTEEEQEELRRFRLAETLVRLIKARVLARKVPPS